MKAIKNTIFTTFLVIFTLFSPVFAQNIAKGTEIAVINIEKISKDAKAVKYIAKKISAKRDKYQKEIAKKEESLKKEKKRIEAKKSILSRDALLKEQEKFFKKVEDLKKLAQKRDKTLKSAYTDSIKKVNEEVSEIVASVAKEQQIHLVLPASQVVFSIESLDITNEVIRRLNKKMTEVKVRFR